MDFRKIDDAIESMQDEIVEIAKTLISFPSQSGQEAGAQNYIKEQLEALQFDQVDMWEPEMEMLKGHEAFVSARSGFEGSPNVVGVLKGNGGGRSLMVNGHIDVVPPGDLKDWTVDPFAGTVRDGRIIGRGISDMKIAHVAFLACARLIRRFGIRMKGDLLFSSVIEEETGGAGSLACSRRGYRADAALIPEPTDYKICPAQQGVLYFKVTVFGKPFHGGMRFQGVSAIEKAYVLIHSLAELEQRRKEKFRHPLYREAEIPFTINVGTIAGGSWPSMVPEKVSFEGRMGVAPGETLEEARDCMEAWIQEVSAGDEWMCSRAPEVEWQANFLNSSQIPEDHPIVCLAAEAYREVKGNDALYGGTAYGTDAGFFTKYSQTPALVFGPGKTAHSADEYLKIEDAVAYTKMLFRIIVGWCEWEE